MAHTEYTLETITLPTGTLTVKLLHGNAALFVPSEGTIISLSPVTETVEWEANLLELPQVDVEVLDIITTDYVRGFWYYALTEDTSVETPEIMFLLDEGSGDTYVFAGQVDLHTVEFEEYTTTTTDPRHVRFTLISNLKRIEDVTFASLITYLKDNYAVDDEQTGARTSDLTVTPQGPSEAITYTYRVAVRTAKGEELWCDAVTTTAGNSDLGTYPNRLAWSTVSGATAYAIYRTVGGAEQGFLGTGTSPFDDTGIVSDATGVQSKYSACKYVTLEKLLVTLMGQAYGGSYVNGRIGSANYDIKIDNKIHSDVYIQLWYNAGDLTGPDMGYTPYFDSTHASYLADKYENPFQWMAQLLKSLGTVPRIYYNVADSRFDVELLTRGKIGGAITMAGTLTESRLQSDIPIRPEKIRVFREAQEADEYYNWAIVENEDYDLEMGLDFLVQTSPAINSWEGFYTGTTNGLGIALGEATALQYYDYAAATPAWVSESNALKHQFGLGTYFDRRFNAEKNRGYYRSYNSIQANTGGANSHDTIKLLRITSINDGTGARTFYANSVSKDLVQNMLSVQWAEQ